MDLSRLVRTHITTGELSAPTELVEAINAGSTALSDLVKALGEYLVSQEDETRLKALTFLGNVVGTITPTRINRPATQTLTSFFLAKLDDADSLPVALSALTVLSKLSTFDDDAAVDVYRGMVEQVNLKSYAQAVRHQAYVLLDSILASHRTALRDLGAEFLNSYTKFVDGEKDPRNLMLLFSMDRVILLEFEVADHIDDMFDITFCYFPIMFKPPPNDPYGITADDLKLALRGCMSASPHFAKAAIPLFLEKFSTATGAATKDLLLSIAACLPVYGAAAVQERGIELWEGIKTEIMYSSDPSIEAAALSALESLIRTLYPDPLDSPAGLAQDIIKQSVELLNEPEKTQATSATKMLAALLRSSPTVGAFAYSQALPQLFRLFNNPSLPSQRSPILSAVSSLLYAARTIYASSETTRRQSTERSLEPFRESLVDTVREGLRTDDLKVPAIKGAVSLIELPDFINRLEVEDIVKGMDDVLINDSAAENRSAVVKGLTSVSKVYPDVVESTTLPLLFHHLPGHAPAIDDTTSRDKYRSILKSLSELCVQPALFETLVVRITTKLDLFTSPSEAPIDVDQTDAEYIECQVAYAHDLLSTLSATIDVKIEQKHVDVVKHFDRIIPRLYTLVVSAAGTDGALFQDKRLLALVGRITETLMWELSVERQNKQFEAVHCAFEKGQWGGIVHEGSASLAGGSVFRTGAPACERNLLSIYSSTVQGLKANTSNPVTPEDFLSAKIRWAVHDGADDFQARYALDMITAYVNKREKELASSIEGTLENVWAKEVIDTELPFDLRRRALLAYMHIVKGLALLRHPAAYTAIDRPISVLKLASVDPAFVDEAARSFGIVAQGKGKGKEKTSHLTAKLLFAQKIWNHVLPRLIEGDQEAKGRDRLPYLVAFSSLLPLVPASLCMSDLSTILPLLLRSLALREPDQRLNAINTLIRVLETQNFSAEVDTLLHQHAVQLVESLSRSYLIDATGEMLSNPVVRAKALRALALVPDAIRVDTLRSHKSGVLRDLGKALDDPIRTVRREAVECRARWYRYGA